MCLPVELSWPFLLQAYGNRHWYSSKELAFSFAGPPMWQWTGKHIILKIFSPYFLFQAKPIRD